MMDINKTIIIINTDDLPRKKEGNNIINWKNSVNKYIHFIYNDMLGDFKIINYLSKGQILTIEYNNIEFNIRTGNLLKGKICKILGKRTNDFKIEIGRIFKDNKRDITIIDREIRPKYNKDKSFKQNGKWYKYHCNKDGYEGWIEESNILGNKKVGCSACCISPTSVVGINTIYDTDKWMIPYIGEECAKTHTKCSHDEIFATCPDCGRIKSKKIKISTIYNEHSIGCSCSDSISYGEKLIFSVLEQLDIDFRIQLNKSIFDWCGKYKYDFYFEYNNEKYVIEVNGSQHYANAWDKLEKTQENDKLKKELALANDIKENNYIVIDCRYSNLEWIKNNENGILDSRLNELFDLFIIDWNKAEKFALSNLVKQACEYKRKNPELTTTDIGKLMKLNYNTIGRYLKKGHDLFLCEYVPKDHNSKTVEILKDGISLGVFKSATELARKSEELFKIKLIHTGISQACLGILKQYKGYTFKFA